MNITITCRECGFQEVGKTENAFMTRVKMFNHVQRRHPAMVTTTSRARMLVREHLTTAQESYEREAYNLEAVY